jgi:hypothetical protein
MILSKTLTDKLADAWSDYSALIREQSECINQNTPQAKDLQTRKDAVLNRIALLSEAVDTVKNGAGIPSSKIML